MSWPFLMLIITAQAVSKEPILELALNANSEKQLQTSFSLGPSEVRVQLQLNDRSINVCCKFKKGVLSQVYYYMINPFRPYQDYNCHDSGLALQDIAKFPKIGPLTVNFQEIVYPSCRMGHIGLSKDSDFLRLLPKNEQYFVLERELGRQNEKRKWRLHVGGPLSENYVMVPTGKESHWAVGLQDISFNQVALGRQRVIITSDRYQLLIPKTAFGLFVVELTKSFECVVRRESLYCPCNRGVSKEFPPVVLTIKNSRSFKILPENYLQEEDEICRVLIKESASEYWHINFQMLHNTDLVFYYDSQPRIGFAPQKLSIENSDSIKEPLQIILNSVVILLMCLFVAMILIEIIKHLTGIEAASSQSFENYMLKHSQQ